MESLHDITTIHFVRRRHHRFTAVSRSFIQCIRQLMDFDDRNIKIWHDFLATSGYEDVLSINQHYFGHLPDMIQHLGPPRSYSARVQERVIGMIKKQIASPSMPSENSTNVLIDMTQITHYQRYIYASDADEHMHEVAAAAEPPATPPPHLQYIEQQIDDDDGGTMIMMNIAEPISIESVSRDQAVDIWMLLDNFYRRHNIEAGDNMDQNISIGQQAVIRGNEIHDKKHQTPTWDSKEYLR